MKKAVIAGLAAASLFGSSLSYAQQPATQEQPERERGRPTQADVKAFADARIAGLKAGLQLTPDQEKKWPPVEQALRELAQARMERVAKIRAESGSEDAISHIRERADAMTQTAAQLRKLADAAEPLYQSLTDDQKRRLRFLIPMTVGQNRHLVTSRHRRGGWRG